MRFEVSGFDAVLLLLVGVAVAFGVLYLVIYNAVRAAIIDAQTPVAPPVKGRQPATGHVDVGQSGRQP